MACIEAFTDLATDSVTLRPILYPYKLLGRFYELSTINSLLDAETPRCPFSRAPISIADVEPPTLFERQFFDLADTKRGASPHEINAAKHAAILFMRRYGWNVEAAELGDSESFVPAALDLLTKNRLPEAKRWALRAGKRGNFFGHDVLGHIAMLEKDYAGAHDHFVKCWAAPSWHTKGKTAYFVAECYFEREMFVQALHWTNRALLMTADTEPRVLHAQIAYLTGKFNECIEAAALAKKRSSLAAFIYAMCALRRVGIFKKRPDALLEGTALMRELRYEGYIEAERFLTQEFTFSVIRTARRTALRPLYT